MLATVAVVYLALVWTLSGLIAAARAAPRRSRRRDDAATWNRIISVAMLAALRSPSRGSWTGTRPGRCGGIRVQHHIIHTGLKETAADGGISVVGAAVIGLVLGTLLTISFRPLAHPHPRSTSRSGAGCRSS